MTVKANTQKRRGGLRKTYKNMKSTNLECCPATFHGLQHWSKHMFEQLGWMILAKKHGLMDKIHAYKNSLQRLKWSMENKMNTMKDSDKKNDLEIMHKNLLCLIEHAEKDL